MSTIKGHVNKGGGNVLGNGYSCTRNREGDYTVKFNKAFTNPPVIVATAHHFDAEGDRVLTIYKSDKSEFKVTTMKGSERRDSAFDFSASDDYNTP